jgi:hypothetical protein
MDKRNKIISMILGAVVGIILIYIIFVPKMHNGTYNSVSMSINNSTTVCRQNVVVTKLKGNWLEIDCTDSLENNRVYIIKEENVILTKE